MEIIDAHIHIFTGDHAQDMAHRAGHENSEAHLREEYSRLGIKGAVVMGNRSLQPDYNAYPEFLRYCVGLDRFSNWEYDLKETYDMVEKSLQSDICVGVKLYPGYNFYYVSDEIFGPIYELAERYGKPVAIHTGETSFSQAKLKYCHPLTLDEVAASFPRVQFVMCHFGVPWFVDAAAVMSKNMNVSADLSGMLEGLLDMSDFFRENEDYLTHIKTWLSYMDAYDRLMFGTDWPLANIQNYIDFVLRLIPEKHHENVFAGNARRIYGLDF
jgi:predicted TIM-barrel fold metal-dependent hydrolase